MTYPVPALKPSRFIKPTLDTPYHVDYGWWDKADRNLRIYLKSHLCALHREMYAESSVDTTIDWVDSYIAEVQRIDGILYLRIAASGGLYHQRHLSSGRRLSRVPGDNQPLSPRELAERIGKGQVIPGRSAADSLRVRRSSRT
jgi:hypothetical protein